MTETPETTAAAWLDAETAGTGIDPLLTDDFTGIGPLGFVLSRADWLDRHRGGALTYTALRFEDQEIREHGDHAVLVAKQTGAGTYRGHPVPEALRATVLLRREPDGWRVAHVHTSFLAGTPGAPPIPGSPR